MSLRGSCQTETGFKHIRCTTWHIRILKTQDQSRHHTFCQFCSAPLWHLRTEHSGGDCLVIDCLLHVLILQIFYVGYTCSPKSTESLASIMERPGYSRNQDFKLTTSTRFNLWINTSVNKDSWMAASCWHRLSLPSVVTGDEYTCESPSRYMEV